MMKRQFILHLMLFCAVLAACAPAASATATEAPILATEPPLAIQPTPTPASPTLEPATEPAAEEPSALPIATSRGPELHATDPTTVSLASGGLQFVEFFRFT